MPTTDITDQTMQDASQAGSSSEVTPLSMSSLQASLPMDRYSVKARMRKRHAEYEAEEAEKKLQQSKASKVSARPLPFAVPS